MKMLKIFLSLQQSLEYSTAGAKDGLTSDVYTLYVTPHYGIHGTCTLESIMEHPHGIMILGTFWLICLMVAAVSWGAWNLLL